MLELGPVAGERSAQAIVGRHRVRPGQASVARLRLGAAGVAGRRGVAAVMIASADGRAAVGGSSAPLLLRALVATRCIDRFLLTLAPMLAAGSGPAVLEGVALD